MNLKNSQLKNDFKNYVCNVCDQTNYNPEVMLYSSNKRREVGQLISNQQDLRIGDNAVI